MTSAAICKYVIWILLIFASQTSFAAKTRVRCEAAFAQVLKSGDQVNLPNNQGGYLKVSIVGSYNGKVFAVGSLYDPSGNSGRLLIYTLTERDLKNAGYELNLDPLPEIEKQFGPSCLPTSARYIQKLLSHEATIRDEDINGMVYTSLGRASVFNPFINHRVTGLTGNQQLLNTVEAFKTINVKVRMATTFEDLKKHFTENLNGTKKYAILGASVATTIIDMYSYQNSYENISMQVPAKSRVSAGNHALVATALVKAPNGREFFLVVDPQTGQSSPIPANIVADGVLAAILVN